jgi:hypothetical protein
MGKGSAVARLAFYPNPWNSPTRLSWDNLVVG